MPSRALAWLRARPTLAAACIYAVLAVAMVSPSLVPGHTLSASDLLYTAAPWQASVPEGVRGYGSNIEQTDAATVFQPFLQYTRASLPDLPLWNPHIMSGRSYAGNAQSAFFSPSSLPAYVLPFWWSLGVIAALKLFVSAFGTFLLARAIGLHFPGALMAGLVFGFGLWTITWLSWPLTSIWALMPWLWLAVDSLVRRPGPLPAAAVAALVALQFAGGHPESSFHVLLSATAFLAFRLWQTRRLEKVPWRALGHTSLWAGGALVLGTAIAAVTILPFVEMLLESADVERREELGASHVKGKFVFGLLAYDWWGRGTTSLLGGFLIDRPYLGALPLTLIAVALAYGRDAQRLFLAGLGGFALGMAFGLPGLFDVVGLLPGFAQAHNGRLSVIFVLCGALLAGWGLQELMARRPSGRQRTVVLGAAALLLAFPVAWMVASGLLVPRLIDDGLDIAWGFATPPVEHPLTGDLIRHNAIILWLTFAGAALLLLWLYLRGRLSARAFAAVAIAVLVADLFRAGMGENPAIPVDHATQPTTGAIRYLQSRAPRRFVGLEGGGIIAPVLPPDLSMRYGLYDARGYDFPIGRRYSRMWRSRVADSDFAYLVQPTAIATPTASALRVYSLLGVTDVVQQAMSAPLKKKPGLRLAYDGPDARIYSNERALPRVFLATGQRVVRGDEAALRAVTAPGFEGRRTVVTERRLPGLADGPGRSGGAARFVSYEADRVVVAANARQRSVLVLGDTHFPGWKARVNGREQPIERVDYLLRGVVVPPGRHEVEFRYEPATWRVGWIVSLLALLGLGATVAFGIRARRRA